MNRWGRALGPAVLLPWLVLRASTARAETVLSLDEVERRALANPNLVAALGARAANAEAGLAEAHGARGPKVGVNVEGTLAPGGTLIDVNSVNGSQYLVQGSRRLGEPGAWYPVPRFAALAQGQMTLYDFGRSSSAVDSAARRVAAAQADGEGTRQNVRVEVRQAYLDWLVAYTRHDLMRARVAQGEDDERRLRERIAAGSTPRAAATRMRASVVSLALEAGDAEAQLGRARLNLERLLDGTLAGAAPAPALLDEAAPPVAGDGALAARTLALEAEAASATAHSLHRQNAPVITAGAEVGLRGQESVLFPAYRVGFSLAMPLWNGRVAEAQARAAAAEAERLRAEAHATLQSARANRTAAASDWRQAHQQVARAEDLRQLARQMVSDAEDRYRLGAADLGALGEARAQLLSAELRLLGAKGARAAAALRLRQEPPASR